MVTFPDGTTATVPVAPDGTYSATSATPQGSGLATAMAKDAAGNQADPTIVISADSKAPHQSVINVMEAARLAGYGRITFTTQSQPK